MKGTRFYVFCRVSWDAYFKMASNKVYQIDASFSCVCPVIDREFRHNIVKVAVDPRGDNQVDPQTALTML